VEWWSGRVEKQELSDGGKEKQGREMKGNEIKRWDGRMDFP
jgi:hypothetical protein